MAVSVCEKFPIFKFPFRPHLDPKKTNFIDPEKDNYREVLSIDEILKELQITKDSYYKCLEVSPDSSYQINFKRTPRSCFTNNYFEEGLLAWEANIDIQPVLDYYKAVAYMCAYLSKSEDESTEAMKQAAKEAYENGKTTQERMKSISKAYRTQREMSIQEAVSIVLPDIWLRKTMPGVTFANSNLPENRYRIFKSVEELSNMDENETNVFKKNMLDRYMDRPNRTFKNGRYAVLDSFCYAQFLANYCLDSKKKPEDENDFQPEILEEMINELSTLPSSVPLMSSKERLKLRKTRCVLRFHVPNKSKKPEAYAHHLLFMYYPFRKEDDLKNTETGTFCEKLSDSDVIDCIRRTKNICEPFGEIVDEAFVLFNRDIRGLDIQGEQENEEIREDAYQNNSEEEDEHDDENHYYGGATAQPAQPIISDEDLNNRIRSLNNKQREIF